MGGFSPWHWLLILAVAVLLFGNRLPEIARSLGRSVNEFKKGLNEVKDQLEQEVQAPAAKQFNDPEVARRLDHQSVVDKQRAAQQAATSETEATHAEDH